MPLSLEMQASLKQINGLSFRKVQSLKSILQKELTLIQHYNEAINEIKVNSLFDLITDDEQKTLSLYETYYTNQGNPDKAYMTEALLKVDNFLTNYTPLETFQQVRAFQLRLLRANSQVNKYIAGSPVEALIQVEDLRLIYQYFSTSNIRNRLERMQVNEGMRFVKEKTRLARSVTVLRNEEGAFSCFLETKSKNKDHEKSNRDQARSGSYKKSKPVWRIDGLKPEAYVNLVGKGIEENGTCVELNNLKAEALLSLSFDSPYTIQLHPSIKYQSVKDHSTNQYSFSLYALKAVGDLDQVMRLLVKPQDRLKVACEILAGIHYMHDEKKMVHQDLKFSNVLIFEAAGSFHAKISDYGFSQPLHHRSVPNATRGYETPHMSLYDLKNKAYFEKYLPQGDKSLAQFLADNYYNSILQQDYLEGPQAESDIWAAGMILFKLFNPEVGVTKVTSEHKLAQWTTQASAPNATFMEMLICKMLLIHPKSRLDAREGLYGLLMLLYQKSGESRASIVSSEFFYALNTFFLLEDATHLDPYLNTVCVLLKGYAPLSLEQHQTIVNKILAPTVLIKADLPRSPLPLLETPTPNRDSSDSDHEITISSRVRAIIKERIMAPMEGYGWDSVTPLPYPASSRLAKALDAPLVAAASLRMEDERMTPVSDRGSLKQKNKHEKIVPENTLLEDFKKLKRKINQDPLELDGAEGMVTPLLALENKGQELKRQKTTSAFIPLFLMQGPAPLLEVAPLTHGLLLNKVSSIKS